MLKYFFIVALSVSFMYATEMGLKGGSCTLAQEGAVTVVFNDRVIKNANYTAVAKSGKNFRDIFIGSLIELDNDLDIKIIDYKPNKRIKGQPKTGVFMVELKNNSKVKTIQMSYIFDDGVMNVIGTTDKKLIAFSTKVNYSLCSVKIK